MNQQSRIKWSHVLVYFLLGASLVSLLGYATYDMMNLSKSRSLLLLTLAGAFGGLSYAMRNRSLELPHSESENSVNPGLLADCFAGVAGAYVIFLIVPSDFININTNVGDIKVLATGIIGGYGGQSLMAQVLSGIVKEQIKREVEEKVTQSVQQVEEKVINQAQRDAEAMELLNRQFDLEIILSPEEIRILKEAIKAASPSVRVQIVNQARSVRIKSWKSNKKLMERTIPIFEALIEVDRENKFHRTWGDLGFALKDKHHPTPEDLTSAITALSRAIEIRDRLGKEGWLWYEFSRAICRIRLDSAFNKKDKQPSLSQERDVILEDIRAAKQDEIIDKLILKNDDPINNPNPINEWLALNKISSETLKLIQD